MAIEITMDQYDDLIIKSKKAIILDLYSTECPPCEALYPKLDFFSKLYGDNITIYKMFRQGNKELALKLGVKSSPTLLFYNNGKEVGNRLSGAVKKSELKKAIIDNFGLEDKTKNTKRDDWHFDIAIIGAGPAGLTAGLYTSRAKLKTIIIEQGNPGGQVNLTHLVANYPGFEKEINGFMLMHHMSEQTKQNGAKILQSAEVTRLDLKNKIIEIDDDKRIFAKSIIIATGAKPKSMYIEGEKEFFGKGISYCATCDGKFYEDKKIFVIGGGDSAIEETLYLTEFAKEITLIHRSEFRANKTSLDKLLSNPKVKVMQYFAPTRFIGDDQFRMLEVQNTKTKEKMILNNGEGVFVFIGYQPQTELFNTQINLDAEGYIDADESTHTNIEGVFAAGDVRRKFFRQITTAVSDGTNAALQAQRYLSKI